MKTTFGKLAIGTVFEFDHSECPNFSGMRGPWRKVSPRKYVHLDNEKGHEYKVGTGYAKVTDPTTN